MALVYQGKPWFYRYLSVGHDYCELIFSSHTVWWPSARSRCYSSFATLSRIHRCGLAALGSLDHSRFAHLVCEVCIAALSRIIALSYVAFILQESLQFCFKQFLDILWEQLWEDAMLSMKIINAGCFAHSRLSLLHSALSICLYFSCPWVILFCFFMIPQLHD